MNDPWIALLSVGGGAILVEVVRFLLGFRGERFDQSLELRKQQFDEGIKMRDEMRRDLDDLRVQVRDLRLKIDEVITDRDQWKERFFQALASFRESQYRNEVLRVYVLQITEWLKLRDIDPPIPVPCVCFDEPIPEPSTEDPT